MTDPAYKTFEWKMHTRGLSARHVVDVLPEGMYANLLNWEARQEGALSTRFGRTAITHDGNDNTPLADTDIHTLGRLKGLSQTYRFAGAGTNLYRRVGDTVGAYTAINGGNALSGDRFSMTEYRPDFSAFPYIFFADQDQMLKDNGTFSPVQDWGIDRPTVLPTVQVQDSAKRDIELFEDATPSPAIVYTAFTDPGDQVTAREDWRTDATLGTTVAGTPAVVEVTPANVQKTIDTLGNSGAVRSSNVATIKTTTAHHFRTGDSVVVAGVSVGSDDFNGTHTITDVPTATTFTYASTGANETQGGGTADVAALGASSIRVGQVLSISSPAEDVIVLERTATTFTARFQSNHGTSDTVVSKTVRGNVAANTIASLVRTPTSPIDMSAIPPSGGGSDIDAEDDDRLHLYLKVEDPANIDEIRILLDVGNGAFDEHYFVKAISAPRFNEFLQGSIGADGTLTSIVFDRASGAIDPEQTGEEDPDAPILRSEDRDEPGFEEPPEDFLPTDDPSLIEIRSLYLLAGKNAWTRIAFKRGDFLAVGEAGTPGHDWDTVVAWKIEITTSDSATDVSLDDFYFTGGSGPDVFAGVLYDYRYTYYNINTGSESNPSETFISDSYVSPRRQPVSSTWTASSDAQVTHVRLYRRGGVLPTGWKLVAETPIGTITFIDQQADRSIFLNKPLEIDNDPPVTSTLNEPVDTTFPDNIQPGSRTVTPASMDDIFPNQTLLIDEEDEQERVWVTSTTGSTFTAFFQRAHDGSSTAIRVRADTRTGKNLHLSAQGYERMWLAGDSDNPHYLYYSKKQRPESFPPQNFIEIGVPSDPIMAVVNYKGQIFVFTLSRVHRIISPGNSTPQRFDTSTKHGLHANFGWTEAEGSIFYISYDGVYRFNGDSSDYMSESTEWLFTGQNLGPVTAMDRAQIGDTLFEYDKNFVYISYVDTSGNRRRIKWDTTYARWLNDDVPATAIFFEKDVFNLVIARANGMIYIDQTGDFDGNGRSGGVQLIDDFTAILQTRSDDQGLLKNDKVYNELSLDIDTQGLNVTVDLLFDNAATVVNLGTVSTANRSQVSLNIGSGLGQTSKNVALRLTAIIDAENKVVTLFEVHLRAVVEAEKRKSFDSYWSKYGTDEFKIIKQGWFEYVASDAAGISFDVYLEGGATPEFTFTLPQSTIRTAVRVRFPANKAKIWRWVATSSSDFQLYDESHLEVKPVLTGKGYGKVKLAA